MPVQFVLSTEPVRYWFPVTVEIPDPENPGAFITQKLKVLFEAEEQDEALAAAEKIITLPTARAQVEMERVKLLRVCKDWDDVVDKDKRPVPFTEDNFLAALQRSWFRSAIHRAYADSLNGVARTGN